MADEIQQESFERRGGTVLRSWVIPEYTQHERSRRWFVVASLVGVVLIVISLWTPNWFFTTPNFMFMVIIILTAVTIFVQHQNLPPQLVVTLSEEGIAIGESFYTYRELGSFWVIYEPPHVKTLYFHFQSAWRPRLPVPLEDEDPSEIRRILLQYLPEDLERESEPTSDALARFFRL